MVIVIPILILIILSLRLTRFERISKVFPGNHSAQALRLSRFAFGIFLVAAIASFIGAHICHHFVPGASDASYPLVIAIGCIFWAGLIAAAILDMIAGRTLRRAKLSSDDVKHHIANAKSLETYDREYRRASKLEAQGHLDQAMSIYQSIVKSAPDSDAARDARISISQIQKRQNS